MKLYKLLNVFSFIEKIEVFKYKIGKLILRDIPKELISCYHFVNELLHRGIEIKGNKANILFDYPVNDLKIKFELKKMSSDIKVFNQIIMNQEYKIIIDLIHKHNITCHTMIDAGANIGLTTLYFKSYFPNINIIALEPSNKTFTRLVKNIQINDFQNITIFEMGIWSCKTKLLADSAFKDGPEWGFRLVKPYSSENGTFEVDTIPNIIINNKIKSIDFLKIDVEGSEFEVFNENENLDWLNLVKILAIEIHDDYGCRSKIEEILIKYKFELSYSGELTIGLNRYIFI